MEEKDEEATFEGDNDFDEHEDSCLRVIDIKDILKN